MMDVVNLDFFKKQLTHNINYYNFLLNNPSSSENDDYSFYRLLLTLYEIQLGVCVNPGLIMDLIDPQNAKCNRPKSFVPINNNLNNSQKNIIGKALNMENLLVLEGPPGTGKTSVIIELIHQLKIKAPSIRVLITSQSHIAVDNVIKDFIEKNQYKNDIARIRQKDLTGVDTFKKYSETAIFNGLLNSNRIDKRVRNILSSFDDADDERFGNIFLRKHLDLVISNKSIVGLTCNSIPGCRFDIKYPFDYVIIDEVGKFSFAELLSVAKISKKMIIIGDPNQLPAVLKDGDKELGIDYKTMEGFNVESFEYINNHSYINALFNSISPACKSLLDTQYRMSNAIGTFISNVFYNGKVVNGRDYHVENAINFISYSTNLMEQANVINTKEQETQHTPLYNEYEIQIIKKLLNDLVEKEKIDINKIAIITPYRNQADRIIKEIPELKERTSTVDSYQGKQYDVIIFSCTRYYGFPGFLDNKKRINVALSRAKEKIYIIGNSKYILQNTTYLKKILDYSIDYTHPITNQKYTYKCNRLFYNGKHIVKEKKQAHLSTHKA